MLKFLHCEIFAKPLLIKSLRKQFVKIALLWRFLGVRELLIFGTRYLL
jgi:lipid-A-disaccharide synthase-like uncharacterized protein